MKELLPKPVNVDQYISFFPSETQFLLQQLRATIIEAAPEAEELISYQMPAYKYNGMLVYFAANKNHIGFYPTSTPVIAFKEELAGFECSKGAIRLPLDQPLPLGLIREIVTFKVEENLEKLRMKKGKIRK
ncbi:MAG: hypothetical protein HOO86_12145 [Bacteroidales bacterium]|nr:hypothetical protein [Bacteroidales bacterium]